MYLCFAPMDGITNCATRLITNQIFKEYGSSKDTLNLWTEFMNVDGFLINPYQVIRHALTIQGEKPILQIYGGKEETLVKAVEKIQSEYYSLFCGIELNTGCPSNTVMKVGGGSDMLKNKEKTFEIIQKLSNIKGPLPFSIKTRAGINEADKNNQIKFLIEISKICKKISIHGRTLKQLYSGDTDRNFIKKVKDSIKLYGDPVCMVIGNGGVKSYIDAQSKLSEFDLDGIMIGQSSIGNPRIFTTYKPTIKEKCDTILKHLDYSIACDQRFDEKIANKSGNITVDDLEIPFDWIKNRCNENRNKSEFYTHSIIEFRKFLFQYVKGVSGSKEWKQHILECKDYKELKKNIISLFEHQ